MASKKGEGERSWIALDPGAEQLCSGGHGLLRGAGEDRRSSGAADGEGFGAGQRNFRVV